ncbi:MAG: 6,7-dimethyl-8-ribityllumazine synthase [Candidatus Latescibacteria bacterium]|jgi:6,7-dimethyl-8-ribityllumazine synthase|nr:6,7-dimethyl-8-ribityllumazine synthase [Candidatus Latescibacterota bacterium]
MKRSIKVIKTIQGELTAKNKRYAVIVSRFNELIGSKLLDGAMDCLNRHDVNEDDVTIYWVPGAFEIPLVAKKVAGSGSFDAVICLGAVIRGETPHFDFVASEASKGIAQSSLETGIPIIFGIVTTDTVEQAVNRAGTIAGNRGFDAALAAIEMSNLISKIGE